MVDKMMRFFVMVMLLFLCSLNADARYVRKLKEPDFFIPEQDKMHKAEKLPEIISVNSQSDSNVPEYKNKYNKYLINMQNFIKTGVIGDDQELKEDLSKMATGNVFEVDGNVSSRPTKEQQEFELLTEKIIKIQAHTYQ